MKKIMKARQRGYDLVQVSISIAIVIGLTVGGLMLASKVSSSATYSDKVRTAVSLSTEIRDQYRTASDFSDLTTTGNALSGGITADTATGSTSTGNVVGTAFALRSGMSDAMFGDVQIGPDSATNGFIIDLINLDEDVCERLGIANLGPERHPRCLGLRERCADHQLLPLIWATVLMRSPAIRRGFFFPRSVFPQCSTA